MNLALDIGNTRTKIGLFRGTKLVEQTVWTDWTGAELVAYGEQVGVERIILCSVADREETLHDLLSARFEVLELDHATLLPFQNHYQTPKTLGKDRLAAVAGARALYPANDCLVIDCGTCIKYEWLTADGIYHGGNIAPGASMRIQAMHHFTARLPEVPLKMPLQTIGQSTQTALQNGALRGAALEMEGFVQLFRAKSSHLQVLLTGGDAAFFAPHLDIIDVKTEPYLTLIGLNNILNVNMRLLALACLLFTTLALSAQPKQNSPYSRYGIGDLVNQYFAQQAGMAGQSAAFHDPFHLNLLNPASYAHLKTTAFETGLYAKYSHSVSSKATQNYWTGNLNYLALGFTLKSPINQVLDKVQSPWQFGMGFALTPYSLVGYNVQTRDTLINIGEVVNSFQGNGGTYRLQWSNAAKYKNTSFGATLGWMFGKTSYENTTQFLDSTAAQTNRNFQDNRRDDLGINGFVWNLGVQHDFVLQYAENDKTAPTQLITIGATGEGQHKLRLNGEQLVVRSRGRLTNGQYVNADTLTNNDSIHQTLTLPSTFTVGIQYIKSNKLKIGGQIGLENWSKYRNELRPLERFRNTFSASAGLEYIPDHLSYNNYSKRVRYRLGAYYRQDPRSVKTGKDVNDLGVTFGFGFPLVLPRQQTSFVNTAFEIGKLGADSPIEETYFRLTLGFTLNDNTWFYKRRFE